MTAQCPVCDNDEITIREDRIVTHESHDGVECVASRQWVKGE